MGTPNRWLHLRHPDGFDDARFAVFAAQCRVWQAYVNAVLTEGEVLLGDHPPPPSHEPFELLRVGHPTTPTYEHFEPERSADGKVVTLPVGGDWTLGTRARFENGRSYLLWEWFPPDLCAHLEEGITEPDLHGGMMPTSWRPAGVRIIGDVRRLFPAAPAPPTEKP